MRFAWLGTSAEVCIAWPCGLGERSTERVGEGGRSGGAAASAWMDTIQETTREKTPSQGDHKPSTTPSFQKEDKYNKPNCHAHRAVHHNEIWRIPAIVVQQIQ